LKKRCAFLAFLVVTMMLMAMMPQRFVAQAWSDEGHMIITSRAIDFLPTGWRQFFKAYESTLNQTSLYPDTIYKSLLTDEKPRHFIDLEVWKPSDPSTGTLHLAVEEFTTDLVNAMKSGDWNSAILYAGRVGHYVADIHQPYHTTVNYNPHGLHLLLDDSIANHYSQMTVVTPSQVGVLQPVSNLTDFMFSIARQSSSFLPVINATLIDEGMTWSDELTAIIQNRTNSAIVDVARVWDTAIVRAGVPAPTLPAENILTLSFTGGLPSNGALDPLKDAVFSIFVCDKMGVGTLGTATAKFGNGQVIAGAVESDISPMGKFSVKVPRAILQQYAGQQVTLSVSVVGNGYPQADKSITLSVAGGGGSIQLPTLDEGTLITVLVAVAVVALLLGAAMIIVSRRIS
jgi:hypothetical protein